MDKTAHQSLKVRDAKQRGYISSKLKDIFIAGKAMRQLREKNIMYQLSSHFAILDRLYSSLHSSITTIFDNKEFQEKLKHIIQRQYPPDLYFHIQTDEKIPIVAKTNKQIDRQKILENTKEMIYAYIERFDKESEIYKLGKTIVENIGAITFINPCIKNNEARIRSFLERLSQADANWIGKNDKGVIYYVDLYLAVINFLHLYEIIVNDIAKMFQKLIKTDLYDLADDNEALQKLKLTKAFKQVFNKRGQIKREVYSWIIRIISENMNLEFKPMISIFRNLLYLDDHKHKYQKFPLITPQDDNFFIFHSYVKSKIKNLQLH